MPKLNNERQELFCRHRASGMLPSKAAVAAGYATGSAIYSKLEEDPEILQRISELITENEDRRQAQREAAKASAKKVGEMIGVGKAWVISQLAENAQNARMDGEYGASNAALEMIGKHFGMWNGQGKEGGSNDTVPQEVDLDALAALTAPKPEEFMSRIEHIPPEEENLKNAERALSLIGQYNNKRGKAEPFKTGSETDVTLTTEIPESDDQDH